eukprot:841664-Amphidinium_carterae.1
MEHLKYALLAQHQSDMKVLRVIEATQHYGGFALNSVLQLAACGEALTQGLQKASMSKASDQSLAAARVVICCVMVRSRH